MPKDRRHCARAPLQLRLDVEGVGDALTRDISADGLYIFISPQERIARETELELSLSGSGLRASARCEVVRVDPGVARTGVALRMHDLKLEPVGRQRATASRMR